MFVYAWSLANCNTKQFSSVELAWVRPNKKRKVWSACSQKARWLHGADGVINLLLLYTSQTDVIIPEHERHLHSCGFYVAIKQMNLSDMTIQLQLCKHNAAFLNHSDNSDGPHKSQLASINLQNQGTLVWSICKYRTW